MEQLRLHGVGIPIYASLGGSHTTMIVHQMPNAVQALRGDSGDRTADIPRFHLQAIAAP